MIHAKPLRRILSTAVAVAMMTSILSTVVDAAVGTWLSPQAGQKIVNRNVEVSVGFNTQSALRVTKLELWIDGRFYAKKVLIRPDSRGVCSFDWDTSRFQAGTHELVVKIFAGDEMISTVSGTGTIGVASYDLSPPAVRFANIKSGDVLKGVRNIRMVADDDGDESPIISLLIDDTLKLLTNRKPYSYDLDTTKYADGDHQLQTFAYDSAGNKSDPAVVKVAFKNNSDRPVVAAMTVEPKSSAVAPSEDDGVGRIMPPANAAPKSESASRSSVRPGDISAVARPADPVARPQVKSVSSARASVSSQPVATRVSSAGAVSQTVAAQPKSGALRPVPSVRPVPVKPSGNGSVMMAMAPGRSAAATEPAEARESSVVVPVSASRPSLRQVEAEMTVSSGPVAEPRSVDAASASEPTFVASAAGSNLRSGAPAAERPAMSATLPHKEISEPVASAAGSVAMAAVPGVRSVGSPAVAGSRPGRIARPEAPVDDAVAASAGPVRVAMAPSLRMTSPDAARRGTIVCPPPARKETRAKIEKRSVPNSGKLRVRDLFEKLGGVVFWDAETHAVTAFAHNLKLELSIGSSEAIVNGHRMAMRQAPRVIDGRTVIDAAVYHQACAMAESLARSASRK